MKKYILLLLSALLMSSCDSFLDTDDYTRKNSDNFPASRVELENALIGIYNAFSGTAAGSGTTLYGTIMSDECFGNGGTGDVNYHAYNRLLRPTNENTHSGAWSTNYRGIWRCNSILNMLPEIEEFFTSTEDKNAYLGQVYTFRAYFYLNLAVTFGPYVPLRLEPIEENKPAATVEELYAQIGDDLSKAISLLPAAPIQDMDPSEHGKLTRWYAQALAARAFLFYTGYYQKTDLPTLSGSITKEQVISWLEECIRDSGHSLLPEFRNNFAYGNELTAPDYKYAKDNNLKWVGDGKANVEAVVVIKYNIMGYNTNRRIYNIRTQPKANTFPFRDGWGATSVNPKFFADWLEDEPTDIRRNATILDADDPNEGLSYQWFVEQGEETGYFIKDFLDINAKDASGDIYSHAMLAYGGGNAQANCALDIVLMRFSDVLLMHSELTGTVTGLNQVRARVGLPAVAAYSLEAIQKERRYELAFMGGWRYYDLLRWYGTEAGVVIDANQNGAVFYTEGVQKVLDANMAGRIRATGGFVNVPRDEIDLSNGVLTQNPGWEGDGVLYQP